MQNWLISERAIKCNVWGYLFCSHWMRFICFAVDKNHLHYYQVFYKLLLPLWLENSLINRKPVKSAHIIAYARQCPASHWEDTQWCLLPIFKFWTIFPDNPFLSCEKKKYWFPKKSLTLLSGSNICEPPACPPPCLDSGLASILIISTVCPGKVIRVYSCYQG